MCTLSIFQDDHGTRITMNRDERLDRKPEEKPFRWDSGLIAPRDSEGGGTWIGLNPAKRKWACLLNGYSPKDVEYPPEDPITRGRIIPALLYGEINFKELEPLITRCRSFRLIFGKPKNLFEAIWDGHHLTTKKIKLENNWFFRSSSSRKQTEIIAHREQVFEEWRKAPELLTEAHIPSFHGLREGGNESSSILMHRPEVGRATTSITAIHIPVDKTEQMKMFYCAPDSPPKNGLAPLCIEHITDQNCETFKV